MEPGDPKKDHALCTPPVDWSEFKLCRTHKMPDWGLVAVGTVGARGQRNFAVSRLTDPNLGSTPNDLPARIRRRIIIS